MKLSFYLNMLAGPHAKRSEVVLIIEGKEYLAGMYHTHYLPEVDAKKMLLDNLLIAIINKLMEELDKPENTP